MGTAILEENVALFRKKKCVQALRQGNSTRGCFLWHCVAGAEKKGTQAPTAKGEDIWNVMEEVWGSQEREIHRGCGQMEGTLRWEKKKSGKLTQQHNDIMWIICVYYLLKLNIPSNPILGIHATGMISMCMYPKAHTRLFISALCNSPTLHTTAGPKADWFNCNVVLWWNMLQHCVHTIHNYTQRQR